MKLSKGEQTSLRMPQVILLTFAVLGVLYILNVWIEGPQFSSYYEGLLVLCGINITLAVALNIVNGFTGQFSLGHIGFYAIGAYVAATLSCFEHGSLFRGLPTDGSSVPILAAVLPMLFLSLVSGGCAATVGFVVGLPSLRLRGDYLAILTLGFAQIVGVIILNIDTPDFNGAESFTGIVHGTSSINILHLTNFFWVFLAAGAVIWVSYSLRFSVHGLAFLSVREDEIAAEAMGVNTTRYKVTAFVISAFFTGVAGAMFGLYEPSLSNGQFIWSRSMDTVVMVVLGGLGSISGVVIAAISLTLLPEALRSLPSGEQYRLVIYPLVLVLIMLIRPQGIFGRNEFSIKNLLRRQAKSN